MRLTRTSRPPNFLYQIIPLLDVLFAVLVFFILSSTFLLQPGVAVHLPESTFALKPSRDPVIISIVGDNTPQPRIFFRDQIIGESTLPQLLTKPDLKGRTMILKADRSVPYEVVMRVANRLLEAGSEVVLAAEPVADK